MKKLLSILCAAALTLSLAACGSTAEDYVGQTLTGQVTAIDGSAVTLQLGELTEDANTPPDGSSDAQTPPDGGSDTNTPPEKPGDASGSDTQTPPDGGSDANTPPEKPDDASGSDTQSPPDGGSAPSGQAPDGGSGTNTPPEKPEGSSDSGTANGQPPAKPDDASGDANGTPPDMPSGDAPSGGPGGSSFTAGDETVTLDFSAAEITENGETVALSDLSEGDVVTVTVGSGTAVTTAEIVSIGGGQGGPGGGFGGSGEVTQGDSANTISEDGTYSGTAYTSTGDDENALRVDGAAVTLDGVTVDKSAGATSNTENGDFYGVNAALLATNGATVTIKNATVTSSAQNGNGVFSYGSGTTVNISDSTITTTADNSGGIQTTGGGTTNASDLTVETSGNSSAAIRSDRGGGTVNVDGGTYTSNGYNSPAVYSTADITVKNAALTANHSEALVIEGKNSIVLENCAVTGSMSDTQGASSDENVHAVMIYQSMSGDADVGTSTFTMTGGSLTGRNGDLFYVTNTHCVLTLSGVTLRNEDADAYLLRIVGNSASHGWGAAGANGAQVEFTADAQTLEGDIVVDTISTLDLTLKNGSSFTGTVNIMENAEGGTAVSDNAVVTIESGCTWTLTGDCVITSLVNNGTIDFNGYTITLADGTVLQG